MRPAPVAKLTATSPPQGERLWCARAQVLDLQRELDAVSRDKDRVQAELKKTNLLKDKLEELCRQLQKETREVRAPLRHALEAGCEDAGFASKACPVTCPAGAAKTLRSQLGPSAPALIGTGMSAFAGSTADVPQCWPAPAGCAADRRGEPAAQ
jgi:hypothetical protein